MKIYLHEITDQDTELDFDQSEPWVAASVASVDEAPSELEKARPRPESAANGQAAAPSPRPIHAHFNLRQVDSVVVASGHVETYLELICSRCANPFRLEVSPSFSSLFCQDPDMAGVAHLERTGASGKGPVKPVGQNKGFARHAHDFGADKLTEDGKDLDITYLSQNFIDLSDLLSEQLQLQIPFQPLCRADCKGICVSCGLDLNVGRCACAKIPKANAFAVLQGFRDSVVPGKTGPSH